jgi:hypothetical protein
MERRDNRQATETPRRAEVLWIPLCFLVGRVGSQKGRSGVGFFFLSFFLSPLIGFLVAICPASKNCPIR